MAAKYLIDVQLQRQMHHFLRFKEFLFEPVGEVFYWVLFLPASRHFK
jgi:hypothetical protein